MIKRSSVWMVLLFFLVACLPLPTPTQAVLIPTSTQAALIPTTTSAAVTVPTSPSTTSSLPTVDPAHLPHLPNPSLTPGDVLDVTPADICVPGYSSKVRNVTEAVKNQVYQEYGITTHQPYEYEVDHLISLELGGSNSVKNLWPEPYAGDWNARVKDKLENKLHDLVCAGSLDLHTAQQAIATDWMAAYLKYLGQP